MPYINDLRRLEQMLTQMAPLAQGLGCKWRIDKGSANTFAYRIREALFIAKQHPTEYPGLAAFASDFSIVVVSSREVIAKRRTPTASPPSPLDPPEASSDLLLPAVDVNLFRKQPNVAPEAFTVPPTHTGTLPLEGPQKPETIITVWASIKGTKRTLYFPDADLTQRQLAELWLWAEQEKVMMLVHAKAITLALIDPQMLEYSYRPDAEYLAKEFSL